MAARYLPGGFFIPHPSSLLHHRLPGLLVGSVVATLSRCRKPPEAPLLPLCANLPPASSPSASGLVNVPSKSCRRINVCSLGLIPNAFSAARIVSSVPKRMSNQRSSSPLSMYKAQEAAHTAALVFRSLIFLTP